MQTVLEWGVSVIVAVQSSRSAYLDQVFVAITNLGSEYFYFAALPFICTVLSRTIGIRIALTILASVMINSLIKNLVGEPRPFTIDPSVALIAETGFGFPSGHTQQAALFWGLAYHYIRLWWIAALGATFVGLVGLSRIYLGVHYPTDVLGALVIAAIILFNYRLIVKHGHNLWRPSSHIPLFGLVMVIAILGSIAIPSKDMISAAGLGSGLIAGLVFAVPIIPLSASWRRRLITAGATAVQLATIFFGLKLAFPSKGAPYYELFSFIRFFLCGLILNWFPLFLDSKNFQRRSKMEVSLKAG